MDIHADWTTEEGYDATVILVRDSHLCGYVAIPKTHRLFGIDADANSVTVLKYALRNNPDIKTKKQAMAAYKAYEIPRSVCMAIPVHGGITYSGKYPLYKTTIDSWCFGFDAAHWGDRTLKDPPHVDPTSEWRDVDYMKKECNILSKQLKNLEI